MSCNQQNGTRLFQINPAWNCSLGPYGWGSPDSETYKYCSNPANFPAVAATVCCTPGYGGGLPLNFTYSTESDGNWKITRCTCIKCIPREMPCNLPKTNQCTSTNINQCFTNSNGSSKPRYKDDIGIA